MSFQGTRAAPAAAADAVLSAGRWCVADDGGGTTEEANEHFKRVELDEAFGVGAKKNAEEDNHKRPTTRILRSE